MRNNNILIAIISIMLIIIGMIFMVIGQPKKEVSEKDKVTTKITTTTTSKKSRFTIDDRTEVCAEALEEIYRDNNYVYYLSCIKSSTIYLVFDNGNEITLRDALDEKIVTIDELIEANLSMYKRPVEEF